MLVLAGASVLRIREFTVTNQLTFDNYGFFLGRWLYVSIFLKTVGLSLLVTGLCIVLAYPFALFLIGLPAHVQRVAA